MRLIIHNLETLLQLLLMGFRKGKLLRFYKCLKMYLVELQEGFKILEELIFNMVVVVKELQLQRKTNIYSYQ